MVKEAAFPRFVGYLTTPAGRQASRYYLIRPHQPPHPPYLVPESFRQSDAWLIPQPLSGPGEVRLGTVHITFLCPSIPDTGPFAGQLLRQAYHLAQGPPSAAAHVDRLSEKRRSTSAVHAREQ